MLSFLLQSCIAASLVPESRLGGVEKTYEGKYYINFKENNVERSISNLETAIKNNKFKIAEDTDNYSRQDMERQGVYYQIFLNADFKIGNVVGLTENYIIKIMYNKNSNDSQIELTIKCTTTKRKSIQKKVEKVYQSILTEYNAI